MTEPYSLTKTTDSHSKKMVQSNKDPHEIFKYHHKQSSINQSSLMQVYRTHLSAYLCLSWKNIKCHWIYWIFLTWLKKGRDFEFEFETNWKWFDWLNFVFDFYLQIQIKSMFFVSFLFIQTHFQRSYFQTINFNLFL